MAALLSPGTYTGQRERERGPERVFCSKFLPGMEEIGEKFEGKSVEKIRLFTRLPMK